MFRQYHVDIRRNMRGIKEIETVLQHYSEERDKGGKKWEWDPNNAVFIGWIEALEWVLGGENASN